MYESAKYGAELKGKTLGISKTKFIELLEENGSLANESVSMFLDLFIKSMTKDVPKDVSSGVVDAEKKK